MTNWRFGIRYPPQHFARSFSLSLFPRRSENKNAVFDAITERKAWTAEPYFDVQATLGQPHAIFV